MLIDSSYISMSSSRSYLERSSLKEDLEIWVGERNSQEVGEAEKADLVTLTPKALASFDRYRETHGLIEIEADPFITDPLYIAKLLIEAMTGEKIVIIEESPTEDDIEAPVGVDNTEYEAPTEDVIERVGWGLIYERKESYREAEPLTTRTRTTG